MAKIQDIFSFNPDLEKHILWQYDNAPILKELISDKKQWYKENVSDFWNYIKDKFLNIKSADDWGLNLWGQILKVKRIYDINGQSISLSTELYRRLILVKLQMLYSSGTIPEIHKYMNFIFSDYMLNDIPAVYVKDNHDMSILYILNFEPTTEELALIYSREFLPTPAGVQSIIQITPLNLIFGFDGSGFQPFNQAPFWDGRFLQ